MFVERDQQLVFDMFVCWTRHRKFRVRLYVGYNKHRLSQVCVCVG